MQSLIILSTLVRYFSNTESFLTKTCLTCTSARSRDILGSGSTCYKAGVHAMRNFYSLQLSETPGREALGQSTWEVTHASFDSVLVYRVQLATTAYK